MQDYTVPTLSLSNSRAKKYHTSSVPTRDYSQGPASYSQHPSLMPNHQSKYLQNDPYSSQQQTSKFKRSHIFPPRAPNSTQEVAPRDINKNVYLQSPEINSQNNTNIQFSYQPDQVRQQVRQYEPMPNYQVMTHSSSGRRLLTNPESSNIVQQQVSERVASKKTDVGKMLFDRKISKLLSEASFYEQQLLGIGKDDLSVHLQELISIKESHISEHRILIEGLTALIK